MKKRICTIAISMLLLVATMVCTVSCAGIPTIRESDEPDTTSEVMDAVTNNSRMELVQLSNTEHVQLMASPTVVRTLSLTKSGIETEEDEEQVGGFSLMGAPLLGAGATYLEKTLTATVLPSDSPDKSVDWSVAWASDASRKNESVSNYVTVTPSSDGSTTASVKCYKGFEGDIIVITVTTRVGGFQASCQVSYTGAPTSLTISTSGKTVKTDSNWNLSMAEVKTGSTETFNIVPDNLLHSVGSSFGDYSLSIESFGGINISQKNHSNTTGADSYTTTTMNMSAANLFESNGYCYASIQKGGGMMVVAHFEIQDGKLVVEARDAISSYYSMSAGRGGYAEGTFDGYIDGKCPYIKVTVTEKNTGLTATINIKTVATVNSVNLSQNSLEF